VRPRLPALVALSVLFIGTLGVAAPAQADDPPAEFGTDYADPRTPGPPVPHPDTTPCSVEIVRNGFRNFDPYTSTFTPPAGCAGPWAKVVLRMDGAVKGVQFDRLGHLEIGGVEVFRTSTPEPSTDGIAWHVEKDVTSYAPLLRSAQPVVMELGNVVNDTYTGVLDIVVTLDFYKAGASAAPASTANAVLPVTGRHHDGADTVGAVTLPRNATRVVGEVYATGSGGGCEEFWDTSAPSSTGYSCPDGSPYREVQVLVDGKVAGIALPYPHIYTGGWSNPYSWRPSPAPRAFDIQPLRYDLTPFTGTLADGKEHEIRVRVVGLTPGQSGWFTIPNLHVWTDPKASHQTHGAITSYTVGDLAKTEDVTGHDDLAGSVTLHATRAMKITGYVDTSVGRVWTTITRNLTNDSDHRWTDYESHDALDATWRDVSSVTTLGGGPVRTERADLGYSKKGYISFTQNPVAGYDIVTDLSLADRSHRVTTVAEQPVLDRSHLETYDGRASWIYGVPRTERHPKGTQTVRYRVTGDPELGCYDHTLSAVNGWYTVDTYAC